MASKFVKCQIYLELNMFGALWQHAAVYANQSHGTWQHWISCLFDCNSVNSGLV